MKKWPTVANSDTGNEYRPHHQREQDAVFSDSPRYVLFKGGEGGGKSVAGIIKTLNRLRRGMSGVMVSKDFEHFKKSLWPEFRRWIPWEFVVDKHKYRQAETWEPSKTFQIVFYNDLGTTSTLICGGMKESEVGSWEGPNINFAHMDEMRHHKSAAALKTIDGRVRIPGPQGEPPQIWITTTPRKHWLFDYFGTCPGDDTELENDSEMCLGELALVVTLLTQDNEVNLESDFSKKRAQTLTSAEARVLLSAMWEDIENTQRFLPDMLLWDACKIEMPPLKYDTPLVVALDAATGREHEPSDCFGLAALSRHPHRHDDGVAVRFCRAWQAKPGETIDFLGTEVERGPERTLRWLCDNFNIVRVVYDKTELVDFARRLQPELGVFFEPFSQASLRYESDKMLLDLIVQKRIAHNGNKLLRSHIDNANRKLNESGKRLRIIKRYESKKVDLAVCLSMGAYRTLRLNL